MTFKNHGDRPLVGIIVLGTRGSLRNPELEKIDQNVRFIPPVFFPVDVKPRLGQLLTEFFLNGRVLISGERGCSQAHINIRSEILSSTAIWTLVLEDDVGIAPDWLERVRKALPDFPDLAKPGVILLNTNPYFDLGPGVKRLNLQPSLANAFLIHKSCLELRTFAELDALQIADWPCSFSQVQFFSLSRVAFDLKLKSTIGIRKSNRFGFLISTLLRGIFAPLIAPLVGLPLKVFFSWCVLGPIRRDVVLRWKWFLRFSEPYRTK
jgi:hypothetical protein